LNANGDGAVNVIVPTKRANIARLMPLARRWVGKTSAAQMKDGASTHYESLSFKHEKKIDSTNLKEQDVQENEQHTGRISSLVVRTEELPLEEGFSEENASK
jgi:hypothetical protein